MVKIFYHRLLHTLKICICAFIMANIINQCPEHDKSLLNPDMAAISLIFFRLVADNATPWSRMFWFCSVATNAGDRWRGAITGLNL